METPSSRSVSPRQQHPRPGGKLEMASFFAFTTSSEPRPVGKWNCQGTAARSCRPSWTSAPKTEAGEAPPHLPGNVRADGRVRMSDLQLRRRAGRTAARRDDHAHLPGLPRQLGARAEAVLSPLREERRRGVRPRGLGLRRSRRGQGGPAGVGTPCRWQHLQVPAMPPHVGPVPLKP